LFSFTFKADIELRKTGHVTYLLSGIKLGDR